MTTEYQEGYRHPHCYKAMVTTTMQKHPYHALKGTAADVTTCRTFYLAHKVIKTPPKPPEPPLPPKEKQRTASAPDRSLCFGNKQRASSVEDYKTVYQKNNKYIVHHVPNPFSLLLLPDDFREWKVAKRQPFKLNDSLKVSQGLLVTSTTPKEGSFKKGPVCVAADSKPDRDMGKSQPFERMTSYRCDYVTHSPQAKVQSLKPANRIYENILSEPEAKKTSPSSDREEFLSTTHADYKGHQCPRAKPVLPTLQNFVKSKEPLETTTTMRADFKVWNKARISQPLTKKKQNAPQKSTASVCSCEPAQICKNDRKPLSPQSKPCETRVCNSNYPVTKETPTPAHSGFSSGYECISNGTEESRRFWLHGF
ncbi:stabilizer of axonemal microtubules 2 [Labrus mixtus]|uniref:stabilizer of axonemal microtubules 2 n=1 Tax=Labrus mixtus TaxID=508554 RepID=UPI0029C01D35|nr:stabilizer of axonemal microtubules 2 [Labrus mixtus]